MVTASLQSRIVRDIVYTMRTALIVLFASLAALLASPGVAGSFTLSSGVWRTLPISYCVNPANAPKDSAGNPLLSDEDFVADVRAAFQTWEDVPSSSVKFRFDGVCDSDPNADWDKVSAIGWGRLHDGNDLGVTYRKTSEAAYLRGGASKEIFEADVIINRGAIAVVRSPEMYVNVILPATLLHETGHLLGLSHSAEPTALMYENLRTRDSIHTTLTKDDIDGVSLLYP